MTSGSNSATTTHHFSSYSSGSGNGGGANRVYRNRKVSLIASSRRRIFSNRLQPPIMWNIQGMRGQMSSNCLWHACKAFFIGLFIFCAGAGMCVVGFYIDGVLGPDPTPETDIFISNDYATITTTNRSKQLEFGNQESSSSSINRNGQDSNFLSADPSRRQVNFSKLSFIGPIIMGIGGFIIVATCVMTFEARDSAAKVGPSSFVNTATKISALPLAIPLIMSTAMTNNRGISSSAGSSGGGSNMNSGYGGGRINRPRNRSVDVRSVASQTGDEDGSTGSLAAPPISLKFDRKIIIDAFKKFSRTLRTSSTTSSTGGGGGRGSIEEPEFEVEPPDPSPQPQSPLDPPQTPAQIKGNKVAEESIQRYPSAPSLLHAIRPSPGSIPEESNKSIYKPKVCPFLVKGSHFTNNNTTSAATASKTSKSSSSSSKGKLRHAVSIDVPSSSRKTSIIQSPPSSSNKTVTYPIKSILHTTSSNTKPHQLKTKFKRNISVPIEHHDEDEGLPPHVDDGNNYYLYSYDEAEEARSSNNSKRSTSKPAKNQPQASSSSILQNVAASVHSSSSCSSSTIINDKEVPGPSTKFSDVPKQIHSEATKSKHHHSSMSYSSSAGSRSAAEARPEPKLPHHHYLLKTQSEDLAPTTGGNYSNC